MVGWKLSRLVTLASVILLALFLSMCSLNFMYESQSEPSFFPCSESNSRPEVRKNFVEKGHGTKGKGTVLNSLVINASLNCRSTKDPIVLLVNAGSPIYHGRRVPLKSWKSCSYKCCYTQDWDEFIDVADLVAFPTFWLPNKVPQPVNQSLILEWQETNKEQIWVGVAMESPYNVGKHGKEVDGVFHWMASYRPDADVRFTYGTFERIDSNSVITEGFLHTWEYQNLYVEPSPISHPRPIFKRPREKKMVAGLVSHCGTWSQRAVLVKSLQKYLEVDIYGNCGPLECPNDDAYCRDYLAANYKFYLALENSLCLDYVTEKMWSVLGKDILPITFSWINNTDAFPPRSYINALDFGSVKELADYMIYLNDNEDEYQSYFKWKKEYRVFDGGDGLCSTCEKLWQRRQGKRNSEGIHADRYKSMLGWINRLPTSTKKDDADGYGAPEFRVGEKQITTSKTCIDPFDHKILLDWMQDINNGVN